MCQNCVCVCVFASPRPNSRRRLRVWPPNNLNIMYSRRRARQPAALAIVSPMARDGPSRAKKARPPTPPSQRDPRSVRIVSLASLVVASSSFWPLGSRLCIVLALAIWRRIINDKRILILLLALELCLRSRAPGAARISSSVASRALARLLSGKLAPSGAPTPK